jgi:hypothetical protein
MTCARVGVVRGERTDISAITIMIAVPHHANKTAAAETT